MKLIILLIKICVIERVMVFLDSSFRWKVVYNGNAQIVGNDFPFFEFPLFVGNDFSLATFQCCQLVYYYGKKIIKKIHVAINQIHLTMMEMKNHYVEKWYIMMKKKLIGKENILFQKESK